jgi:hypothetical protein
MRRAQSFVCMALFQERDAFTECADRPISPPVLLVLPMLV